MLILHYKDGWISLVFYYYVTKAKFFGGDFLLTKTYGLMEKSGLGKFDLSVKKENNSGLFLSRRPCELLPRRL
jgi:hypothetical protein